MSGGALSHRESGMCEQLMISIEQVGIPPAADSLQSLCFPSHSLSSQPIHTPSTVKLTELLNGQMKTLSPLMG